VGCTFIFEKICISFEHSVGDLDAKNRLDPFGFYITPASDRQTDRPRHQSTANTTLRCCRMCKEDADLVKVQLYDVLVDVVSLDTKPRVILQLQPVTNFISKTAYLNMTDKKFFQVTGSLQRPLPPPLLAPRWRE